MPQLPPFGTPALPLLLPAADKHCRKCGLTQPLACFPFCPTTRKYLAPCKACHAVAMKVFRNSPQHAERIREKERVRSAARRAARREACRPGTDVPQLRNQPPAGPGNF